MIYVGEMNDRLGRPGVAIATNSKHGGLPNRHVLLFEPNTGALLAYEQILSSDPGALGVKIPAVISYTAFLASGRTDTTAQPPG